MTYVLRDVSLMDFDQINSLGRWFQENSNYVNCGWSPKKALVFVHQGSKPESNTFMKVCELNGEIVGFFLGELVEYFFSQDLIAQELVMVFKPNHREGIGDHLKNMISEFTDWSKSKGAVEVCVGITSGIAGKGYEKLLKQQGFKEVGLITKKEV